MFSALLVLFLLRGAPIHHNRPASSSAISDMSSSAANSFPQTNLIPKEESNVVKFLNEHPEYDGRNTRIGILDSGIDPGSDAIYTMLDGTPKLVDVIDCSGAGDVDVSTEAQATWVEDETAGDAYWSVKGLTGRQLKLNKDWTFAEFPTDGATSNNNKSPSSEKSVPVRLGFKRGYDLYAGPLTKRIRAERHKNLNVELARYESAIRQELAEWKEKHSNTTDPEARKLRDDLNARLEVLASKAWQDEDPGPVYDCLVFFDGRHYRAVVGDTDDLRNSEPMTSFGLERKFQTLSVLDQLNFAVQFYDQGKTLSIVVDSSPHGTHVGGIAAAAEGPDRNGVAPGAELVSLKIGDARMGGMETGGALTRALIEAIRLKCDVINMSYGEADQVPNSGRFVQLAKELVWKHGIEFVSSGGNNGPALTTSGSPGSTSSVCFGVAAAFSPTMSRTLYSLPVSEESVGQVGSIFTWSSVGPTADGDNGVNIMAPGGAIAPISNWCLAKTRLMNGTSMSSPHAVGCVALLISACKMAGITISPARLRRALMNTAAPLPGMTSLEQGSGMIQVDKAWEYLQEHRDNPHEDIFYQVSVGNARGIYLRQSYETTVENTFTVTVDPQWRLEECISQATQEKKISFETQFQLSATADWITCPKNFVVLSGGRSFKIVVNPANLPPGLHTAQVNGMDSSNPNRGILFSVPVTVAKPLEECTFANLGRLTHSPAERKRFFLVPPLGSTWMDVTIKDARKATSEDSASKLFALHTVQLLPHAAFRENEEQKYLSLRPAQTSVISIPVEQGITVELCLARYWSTLGNTSLDLQVEFRGVRPSPSSVTLSSDGAGSIVRVTSDLGDESINPKAKLTTWSTPLRPKAGATISPLGERDIFPSPARTIHELILTYEFTQEEKGSITPRVPALQGALYDNGFEGQLILLFGPEKMLLGTCDAWPSAVEVPKGKAIARLQLRHESPDKLEAMKDLTMWIERKISDSISLSVFETKEKLVMKEATFKKCILRKGASAAFFIDEPSASKLPSPCKAGDILAGSFTIGAGDDSLPGSGKRPNGFPLRFVVGPKAEKAPSDPEPPEDTLSVDEKLAEAVRDLKVGQLQKLTKEEGKFEDLYASLAADYPNHLPLLMAKLKYLDSLDNRTDKLDEIESIAKAVLDEISEPDLALHFGRKVDTDDPAANKERREMKDRKSIFIEALARLALAYGALPDSGEQFTETLTRLKCWVDVDEKHPQVAILREERAGRWGLVLKIVNKLLSKELKEKEYVLPISKPALFDKRVEALSAMKYEALVEHDKMSRVISCPPTYAAF